MLEATCQSRNESKPPPRLSTRARQIMQSKVPSDQSRSAHLPAFPFLTSDRETAIRYYDSTFNCALNFIRNSRFNRFQPHPEERGCTFFCFCKWSIFYCWYRFYWIWNGNSFFNGYSFFGRSFFFGSDSWASRLFLIDQLSSSVWPVPVLGEEERKTSPSKPCLPILHQISSFLESLSHSIYDITIFDKPVLKKQS